MRIFLKTEDEINLLRAASQLASYALAVVGRHVVPGIALSYLREQGFAAVGHTISADLFSMEGVFTPKVDFSFVVNGTSIDNLSEGAVALHAGDFLAVDCWAYYGGCYSFAAFTFYVNNVKENLPSMLLVRNSLKLIARETVAGHHLKNVRQVVNSLHGAGQYTVQDIYGHGIGRSKSEQPMLRISAGMADNLLLKAGMCLTISPTVRQNTGHSLGDAQMCGSNQSLFVRYGQTLVVRQGRAEILTSLENID